MHKQITLVVTTDQYREYDLPLQADVEHMPIASLPPFNEIDAIAGDLDSSEKVFLVRTQPLSDEEHSQIVAQFVHILMTAFTDADFGGDDEAYDYYPNTCDFVCAYALSVDATHHLQPLAMLIFGINSYYHPANCPHDNVLHWFKNFVQYLPEALQKDALSLISNTK